MFWPNDETKRFLLWEPAPEDVESFDTLAEAEEAAKQGYGDCYVLEVKSVHHNVKPGPPDLRGFATLSELNEYVANYRDVDPRGILTDEEKKGSVGK